MRKLTLLGFLCEYVKSLSENNTLNIHKLTSEIYSGNYRLKEPLFLYCYYNDKSDILLKYISEDDKQEFQAISVNIKKNAPLPADYMKVLNSYKCRIGMKENDEHIKALMIDKIIKLKETKHISNYRIYTELGINAGNFNDFVKNRNLTRLSLNKSREVYNYLLNL